MFPPAPAAARLNDHGVFVLTLAGRKVGTESFDIRASGDTLEAEAQIELRVPANGKTVEVKTHPDLVLNSALEPLTYHWTQTGAQASELSVDFRSSPARCHYRTVKGEEDNRDFDLAKDVVVLDENVFHHYAIVAGRYNTAAGGKQTFKAFVPQDAAPGELTVEALGKEGKLRHFEVVTELSRIELWLDEEDRLERVAIPETQFEALRKK